MHKDELAVLGGPPVRTEAWPEWPRAHADTEEFLLNILRSRRWAISGPYTGQTCYERRFASAFSAYNGQRYCVPTTNGTAALTISLLALDIRPGDEVLVPGLAWVACASCVLCLGAVPVLVDIDPDTLAMSVEQARAAITDRTAAILLVHPYCRFANLDEFLAVSTQHDVPIVEDCSHAHGACWRGRRAGSFGRIGCFSMQQTKVLTSGEGGAALTDDPGLYDRMEQLRSDGRRFSTSPSIGALELEDVGEVQGQNHSLSEFQAAILLSGLSHLDEENKSRAHFVEALLPMLEEFGVTGLPHQEQVTSNTYYRLVLRIDRQQFGGTSIRAIARAMSAELGVQLTPFGQPLNNHRLYNPLSSPRVSLDRDDRMKLNPKRFRLPVAESVCLDHLTVPHHVLLSDEEALRDIVSAFEKVRLHSRDLSESKHARDVAS
jgi:dTDP-4-amino-4,6-dideoxygalactose transaminase